jgi:hypothetical protein
VEAGWIAGRARKAGEMSTGRMEADTAGEVRAKSDGAGAARGGFAADASEQPSKVKPTKQATRKATLASQLKRVSVPETETMNIINTQSGPETESAFHRAALDPETEVHRDIFERYSEYIGETPLVELTCMRPGLAPGVQVFAKCEFFNPGFSIKDRIVRNIMNKAEAAGKLRPGMTVVAASSGNTGASTAMMCAMRGYKCIITTSPKCSKEKMDAIRAYGAELIVSPAGAKEGESTHYMEIARLLALADPALYFDMDQYETPCNPEGHFLTLGPENWDYTSGRVTHYVAVG